MESTELALEMDGQDEEGGWEGVLMREGERKRESILFEKMEQLDMCEPTTS